MLCCFGPRLDCSLLYLRGANRGPSNVCVFCLFVWSYNCLDNNSAYSHTSKGQKGVWWVGEDGGRRDGCCSPFSVFCVHVRAVCVCAVFCGNSVEFQWVVELTPKEPGK